MPRLIPSNSMPFGSPSLLPPPEAASTVPSSVRLSCSSPGGRTVHSLSATSSGAYYIETHSLPLVGTAETDQFNHVQGSPSIIRTRLPDNICSALSRYPAIELLCVDVSESTSRNEKALAKLPSLCIYTKKDVFVLDIDFDAEDKEATEVEGVVSISEPYERFLIENAAVNVLRIRQAPQKFNGYATLCPAGAMSMLTQHPSTNEYCLCVYHGSGKRSPSSAMSTAIMGPTSHCFRMEDVADPSERITDFCFCQSMELPLLSSLTVALLKASGEVHFATPIVFQGTVVPSLTVTKTLDFLDSSLKESDPNTTTWRQFRAAKQFLIDAFPNNGGKKFVTVGQISGRSRSSLEVFNWHAQIQGPILFPPHVEESSYGDNNDDYHTMPSAESIEPFATEGDLVGLSIGHRAKMVDIAVVSPSSFVPRFSFENLNDTYELNRSLTIGHIVNRVNLGSGSSNGTGEDTLVKGIKLIPDPVMGNVIHYMTPNQIVSICTNAIRIECSKVRENGSTNLIEPGGGMNFFSPPSRRSDLQPKTTAWKCFDVSFFQGSHNSIVGAVISNDIQLGHTLVVRMSDGKMTAINLTETRHLRELENFSAPDQFLAIEDAGNSTISETESQALTALDQSEALSTIVQPLMRDVIDGLGGLAQVGGTATAQEDVSPDILAGFVGIESKCKKQIFLPLITMNEHVTARKADFKAENGRRRQQLNALKEMIARLREKESVIKEKTDIMRQNCKSLADRSASVLQSSQDLKPTITQAEYDYFQELKRLDGKTKTWESQVHILSRRISSLNDSTVVTDPDLFGLSPQDVRNVGHLLKASSRSLDKHERSLISAEDDLDGLASVVGFARDKNKENRPDVS